MKIGFLADFHQAVATLNSEGNMLSGEVALEHNIDLSIFHKN